MNIQEGINKTINNILGLKTDKICKKCNANLERWCKDYQFMSYLTHTKGISFTLTHADIYGCIKCGTKYIEVLRTEILETLK